MTRVVQDLRFGVRALARHRAYAAVAILTPGFGVGVVIGLAGSLALSRTMSTFLCETSALDPLIYLLVPALLAVTVVACLAPAAPAARFDPVRALRNE